VGGSASGSEGSRSVVIGVRLQRRLERTSLEGRQEEEQEEPLLSGEEDDGE
jgi:hypothetical protein